MIFFCLKYIYLVDLFIFFVQCLGLGTGMVDFKNTSLLRKFVSLQGKIFPKRINKVSFKYQRSISLAL